MSLTNRLNRLSRDFLWTSDGDYFHDGRTGSFWVARLTEDEILYSSILKRLQSTRGDSLGGGRGDWRWHPQIGTNLYRFVGAQNTPTIHDEIRTEIIGALTEDDLISPGNINVEVFPISPHAVLAVIFATSLEGADPVVVSFDYDLRDNKVFPRSVE